jgi:hypothetical protein
MRGSLMVLFTVVIVGSGTAPAAAAAAQECRPGFVPKTTQEVIGLAGPGSDGAVKARDANRDGRLCVKIAADGSLAQFVDN